MLAPFHEQGLPITSLLMHLTIETAVCILPQSLYRAPPTRTYFSLQAQAFIDDCVAKLSNRLPTGHDTRPLNSAFPLLQHDRFNPGRKAEDKVLTNLGEQWLNDEITSDELSSQAISQLNALNKGRKFFVPRNIATIWSRLDQIQGVKPKIRQYVSKQTDSIVDGETVNMAVYMREQALAIVREDPEMSQKGQEELLAAKIPGDPGPWRQFLYRAVRNARSELNIYRTGSSVEIHDGSHSQMGRCHVLRSVLLISLN